jgi:hypothetical protein
MSRRIPKSVRRFLFWLAIATPICTAAAQALNGDMNWRAALAYLLIELPMAIGGAMMRPPGTVEDGTLQIPDVNRGER